VIQLAINLVDHTEIGTNGAKKAGYSPFIDSTFCYKVMQLYGFKKQSRWWIFTLNAWVIHLKIAQRSHKSFH